MSEVEFELRKLGDLIEIFNNKRVPLSAKQREGLEKIYPYYGAQGIVDYVDDYIFDGKYILIAEDGENLKSNNKSICTLATGKYWVNNHAHIIKGNEGTNTDFLYYKLNSINFAPYITGSAQPKLNKENLLNIELYIPSKEHQDKMAKVLTLLDQKIQINNQINQELEAMAKTLYDYWFVQFDFPDQNGKPYKSSGGKMVYNPELKREIPEGWGVENLFDVAEVQYGYPFSTDYFNSTGDGVPVIRIRDILGNDITNFSTEEVEDKYKINVGDVLVGMDGNFHMNYWIKEDCYLNQRVVKVNSDRLPNMVLKYQIEPFIKLREKSVSRTTVGHLSDKDLKAINVILPKEQYLSPIFEKFEKILKNIIINQQQNQELTQLRDWLLPMLMNGQVII